jgi:flagella basal body P-ring formation protein FlgA
MGVGLDRGEIVDADDLDVVTRRFGNGAQHVATDATEPVDPDSN